MSTIPSEEDFERASRLAAKRSLHLDSVAEAVKREFGSRCPLETVFVIPQRNNEFRAFIFYQKIPDVEVCLRDGTSQEIEEFIYGELERVGRGSRDTLTVEFEFDSDENVQIRCEGDYFLRLR
jgi:hypothetical protein